MKRCQDSKYHRYRRFDFKNKLGIVMLCSCGHYIRPYQNAIGVRARCAAVGCSNEFELSSDQVYHRIYMICPACKTQGHRDDCKRPHKPFTTAERESMLKVLESILPPKTDEKGPWSDEDEA